MAGVYREIIFPGFVVNNSQRDKWFISKDREVFSFELCKLGNGTDKCVLARKLVYKSVFYEVPVSSDKFDIYKSDGKLSDIIEISLSKIDRKVFAMPLGDSFVFAPLRHTT